MQVIIYKNDNGGVSVIHPTQEALDAYGLEAIALKDVPSGKPFKIVDITDLPNGNTLNINGLPNIDRSFRDQWDIDEADLTDGVGSKFNDFEGVLNELNQD